MVGRQLVIPGLPAYNAERTLEKTVHEVLTGLVDAFVPVDQDTIDGTPPVALRSERSGGKP